ncbi:MAG: Integral rane sensor signal transduction histidine kinase, partial [Verrucomicrobiales bacterium]|nr:Integral rane sensor signal transduction histidine kinase [Verrucomicrobiales bacterium]
MAMRRQPPAIRSMRQAVLWLAILTCFVGGNNYAGQGSNSLEIRSVVVQGKSMPWRLESDLRLEPFPKNIVFNFGRETNSGETPLRLHYKLEGFEDKWREGGGEMFLVMRFLDEKGDRVAQKVFRATGESAGWSGALKGSTLTHRRETVAVPPRAVRIWLVISSGGPPATVGLFVVDDLVVSKISSSNGPPVVLLRTPFEQELDEKTASRNPPGWMRDGIRPSMAKVVELGREPKKKARAIWDEDTFGHAEWQNPKQFSPRVAPDDSLVVEWNEVFSIGVGN